MPNALKSLAIEGDIFMEQIFQRNQIFMECRGRLWILRRDKRLHTSLKLMNSNFIRSGAFLLSSLDGLQNTLEIVIGEVATTPLRNDMEKQLLTKFHFNNAHTSPRGTSSAGPSNSLFMALFRACPTLGSFPGFQISLFRQSALALSPLSTVYFYHLHPPGHILTPYFLRNPHSLSLRIL